MTLQFKIQLKNISKPPVWRRVLMPGNFNFLDLHEVIQAAFGWTDTHLFQFSPSGYGSWPIIGIPDEFAPEMKKAYSVSLKSIFKKEGDKYTYIYDFGDDWIHSILLEKITADKIISADCIDGKGACPPEDCGGPWGYERLIEVLADTSHPEYEEMKEWMGLDEDEVYNPRAFDLAEAKECVKELYG